MSGEGTWLSVDVAGSMQWDEEKRTALGAVLLVNRAGLVTPHDGFCHRMKLSRPASATHQWDNASILSSRDVRPSRKTTYSERGIAVSGAKRESKS